MNGEKEATVLGAFLVARFSVGGRRGSSGQAWNKELEGARDDSKFNGQMGERFAIDLRVDGMMIERLADQRVRLAEMDAAGAAEAAHPERRQITQIAEPTLRGERHDLELILEEVRASGDFEGAAVIPGAAN